jgi:hypothetical protein
MIKLLLEVLAFSPSYALAPPPPPPLSPVSEFILSQSSCVSPIELADEKGGGGEAKSYDDKKAWSSINHSILSEHQRNI